MKKIAIGLVAALIGAATQASAQFAPPSGGEMGAFLKCFYECKKGPDVQGTPTFQEITTLMIANEFPDDRVAQVFYVDGQEQCIAQSVLSLSPLDLDELNVCHTLEFGLGVVPEAGLVEIAVGDPTLPSQVPPFQFGPGFGIYAWGKNVLGKFRRDNPEPFEGRVTGIGKYECRMVPIEVRIDQAIATMCMDAAGNPVPEIPPVLVEQTDDPPTTGACENDPFPVCGGSCPPGLTCQGDPAQQCVCLP
jgi:hypothetical protein